MATTHPEGLPKIGDWYLEADTEDEFQVIDVDPDEGMIEFQYWNPSRLNRPRTGPVPWIHWKRMTSTTTRNPPSIHRRAAAAWA